LIEVERNQVQRETQEKQFLNAEKLEREKEAISVVEKISPANFDLDQENISKNWSKEPQFGLWLLKDDKMAAWLDSKDLDAEVLWLKGIPGAGKIDPVHRRQFQSSRIDTRSREISAHLPSDCRNKASQASHFLLFQIRRSKSKLTKGSSESLPCSTNPNQSGHFIIHP
jgi:hypothetical protein